MDKKAKFAKFLGSYRNPLQGFASLLTNIHIGNFLKGDIYKGKAKSMCVPGLNCYSCPGATGSCPIGAFQATVGSSKFSFAYYVTGILILFGVLLGRFICGFLCPFGFLQDLLYKIPSKKFSTQKLRLLKYLKYVILALMVIILPIFVTNELGMSNPFFCKYLCPQGALEGAIPLSLVNPSVRNALGKLFTWKFFLLIITIVSSIFIYRPFCKFICPLGAFYALMNKVSFLQMKVDFGKCISCNKCYRVCKMDVDVRKSPNHAECIRCGLCAKSCPTGAISYKYGFGESLEKKTFSPEILKRVKE